MRAWTSPCDKQLAIVDIGVDKDARAGHPDFPAVLSYIWVNTHCSPGRPWRSLTAETADIAREFGIDTVPSFVFLADGKVWDRYSGDRVELMTTFSRFKRLRQIGSRGGAKRRMSTAEEAEDRARRGSGSWLGVARRLVKPASSGDGTTTPPPPPGARSAAQLERRDPVAGRLEDVIGPPT